MPSERIANDIQRSLAEGERFADFAYLFDALILLRRPFHQDLTVSEITCKKSALAVLQRTGAVPDGL
jgi:hypothetical protein